MTVPPGTKLQKSWRSIAIALFALCFSISGCGSGDDQEPVRDGDTDAAAPSSITVYSGRNENLIGPLLARFTEDTGIAVQVRYGDTAELAATILEEGAASPADVFFAQDAGALGAVANAGRFQTLAASVLERTAPEFRAADGTWVGVSGRARVVVYNPDRIVREHLPQSLDDVSDPRYRGTFGLAPANGSFQAHMALMRAVRGSEALDAWLQAVTANEPQRYANNRSIVEATINGEIDWGLVNHYYLHRALAENPDVRGVNYFMPADDGVSAFMNVAGVGVLADSQAARTLVDYLLSEEAQRYFAQETFEYPLLASVETAAGVPSLAGMSMARVESEKIAAALAPTLEAIQRSGLLP